jgi:hypothetical protein
MAVKAGLKAGLIGAVVLLVLALLRLVVALLPPQASVVGCVCCALDLLVYVGIGVLAGFFLMPPRSAGSGAGAGALAGVLGGLGAGIGQIVTGIIGMLTGISAQQSQQMLELFEEWGIVQPGMMPSVQSADWGSTLLGGGLCCFGSLLLGAALGAIGGAILGAAKRD